MPRVYLNMLNSIGETMKYSVHIITAYGKGSYLSVNGRTYWGKRTAIKHAKDIISTKNKVFDAEIVEVEDDFGMVVKTFIPEVES